MEKDIKVWETKGESRAQPDSRGKCFTALGRDKDEGEQESDEVPKQVSKRVRNRCSRY
jgi:hypothetical protein